MDNDIIFLMALFTSPGITLQIRNGLSDRYNEEKGLEQGTLIERIRLITKKVNEGKALDQIADEMEIDSEELKPLWEEIVSEVLNYNEKKSWGGSFLWKEKDALVLSDWSREE